MFVKTPDLSPTGERSSKTASRLFHISTTGFYAYVQMLTAAERSPLAVTANDKYRGVDVSDKQIVNLILSRFVCSLTLYDNTGNEYLITGRVTDFRHFPLRIDFEAPRDGIEWKLFNGFKDDDEADLHFTCRVASCGKIMRTNTLTIGLEQVEVIGLVDKLFGSTLQNKTQKESVYVTRDQMTELSCEICSTMNIVEDYEMPQFEFSEVFVSALISQAATRNFDQVLIDTALATLSTCGFDFKGDIKPDEIKRELMDVLKVETSDNKSRIVDECTNSRDVQPKEDGSGSSEGSGLGFKAALKAACGR